MLYFVGPKFCTLRNRERKKHKHKHRQYRRSFPRSQPGLKEDEHGKGQGRAVLLRRAVRVIGTVLIRISFAFSVVIRFTE